MGEGEREGRGMEGGRRGARGRKGRMRERNEGRRE